MPIVTQLPNAPQPGALQSFGPACQRQHSKCHCLEVPTPLILTMRLRPPPKRKRHESEARCSPLSMVLVDFDTEGPNQAAQCLLKLQSKHLSRNLWVSFVSSLTLWVAFSCDGRRWDVARCGVRLQCQAWPHHNRCGEVRKPHPCQYVCCTYIPFTIS